MRIRNGCLLLLLLLSLSAIFSCKMSKEQQKQIYLDALEKAREKDYQAALEIIEMNIRRIDKGYTYYFYHGFFIQQQDHEKNSSIALFDFIKAYEFDSDTYDINSIIGFTYVSLEEYEQAIPYLERAYELFLPESEAPPPYWELAEAYRHVGRLDDALKINTKAINEGDYSWNYLQRGIILSQFGNVQALTENYEIAVTMIEEDNLLLLLSHRDYALRLVEMDYTEKAYQLYDGWIKGNETYYDWCYADMGYILMLNGDWEGSIQMLKKAEIINNTSALTLRYLSFYYFFREDYNTAYEYEARSRLQKEYLGIAHWKKSTDEFRKEYKNNWQFQKLLAINGVSGNHEMLIN